MLLRCRATVFSLSTSSVGDRVVGTAGRHQPEHLELARAQDTGVGRSGAVDASRSSRSRSGAAPSSTKTARAPSSSSCAVSSSPSSWRARPSRTRVRAPSYRACRPRQPSAASRSASRAARGLALGEQHRAARVRGHGEQHRHVDVGGDGGELVGGDPRRRDVTGRERDLDAGSEQPGPGQPVGHLLVGRADRSRGRVEPALGDPQQGEPRLRVVAALAGLPVGGLGLVGLAAQPVQLGELVHRRPSAGCTVGVDSRSQASRASCIASGQSPDCCITSDRCTRHWPR